MNPSHLDPPTESQTLAQRVLEALPLGIWVLDEDGRVVHANSAASKLAEKTEAVVPPSLRLPGADGSALDVEREILTEGGEQRTVIESVVPLMDGSGHRAGAVMVRHDVTQRNRRLRARHDLLEQAALAANQAEGLEQAALEILEAVCRHGDWSAGHLWIERPDDHRLLSTGFWRLRDPVDDWAPLIEASHAASWEAGRGLVGEVATSGLAGWSTDPAGELISPRAEGAAASGAQTWVGSPVSVRKRTIAVLELFSNEKRPRDEQFLRLLRQVGSQLGRVLERSRAETERSAWAKDLERSNRELEEFVLVASHDLQEPLRKVTAFGQRLERASAGRLDAKGLDSLERMQRAARHMSQLLDDLLELSRVATRARPFTSVALGPLVRRVLDDLEITIQEAGARIEVGDLPSVQGDASQLYRVVQNLVSNALKFHRPDQVPEVSIHSARTAGGGWAISVEDRGIGFEPKYRDQILKPFQRLHGRHAYPGTGIGLSICDRIVARHGGRLVADARPGEGATFTIELPPRPPARHQWIRSEAS